jgi:hypothetical protein
MMAKKPWELHRFYKEESQFTHCEDQQVRFLLFFCIVTSVTGVVATVGSCSIPSNIE